MTAKYQYQGVDSDKSIGQTGQGKSPVGKQYYGQNNHDGRRFQNPGEARILWMNSRPYPENTYY